MNKKVDFILCLLLGYIGIHKFYEKKILIGILYLFTGGIFLIGWFYDCIKLGISLYNTKDVLNPKTPNMDTNFSQNNIDNFNVIEKPAIESTLQNSSVIESKLNYNTSNSTIEPSKSISKREQIASEINPFPFWNEGTDAQQEFATDLVDEFCNRFAKYLCWGIKDHIIESNDISNIENALFMAIDAIDDAKWWCNKKDTNDFTIATNLLKDDDLCIDIIKKLKKKYN